MSNNRDTQFMGFVKALVTEIINEVPATIYPLEIDISDKFEKLLARRAYDFAHYIIVHSVDPFFVHISEWIQERVEDIPDLTELPKEK